MRSLLIVGDESLASYARALEAEGYSVYLWLPGIEKLPETSFDVVVLDLTVPGEDTNPRHFLGDIQGQDAPAIIAIFVPEQLAIFDPTKNLDDFILAGTTPTELSARVRQALWKRSRWDAKDTLKCGDLVMDLENYTVHVAGRPVELTYKEYELLRFLATNRDRVFSRETLLNKVWGYDFYGGARTVDVHIRRLRSKIEDRHHTFIETVRNVGYRFRVLPQPR